MRLEEWLRDREISQTDFAKKVGISPSMMSRIIGGSRNASIYLVGKIETLTGGAVGLEDWLNQNRVKSSDGENVS